MTRQIYLYSDKLFMVRINIFDVFRLGQTSQADYWRTNADSRFPYRVYVETWWNLLWSQSYCLDSLDSLQCGFIISVSPVSSLLASETQRRYAQLTIWRHLRGSSKEKILMQFICTKLYTNSTVMMLYLF